MRNLKTLDVLRLYIKYGRMMYTWFRGQYGISNEAYLNDLLVALLALERHKEKILWKPPADLLFAFAGACVNDHHSATAPLLLRGQPGDCEQDLLLRSADWLSRRRQWSPLCPLCVGQKYTLFDATEQLQVLAALFDQVFEIPPKDNLFAVPGSPAIAA